MSSVRRHTNNYTLSVDKLFDTPGNPFMVEAALGNRMVVWSEPLQHRLMQATWGASIEDPLGDEPFELLSGRAVIGVVYSEYFGRVYITNPSNGEVLSVLPNDRSNSAISHFSISNHADDLILKTLRPYHLIVDENTGAVYFNALPMANLSAYNLADPNMFTEPWRDGLYVRPPYQNYTGESKEGRRLLTANVLRCWGLKPCFDDLVDEEATLQYFAQVPTEALLYQPGHVHPHLDSTWCLAHLC